MRIADRLALASLLLPLAAPLPAAELVNQMVLRVNGEIATLAEYQERRDARIEQISQASNLSLDERRRLVGEAGRRTMREMFEELLVLSRAQQLRLSVTPAQIDQAIEAQKQRFGLEDREEFERALAQSGFTLAEFRKQLGRTLLLNEVLDREVRSQVAVGEEELLRYWKEHPEEFRRPEQRRIEELIVREDSGLSAAEREALAATLAEQVASGGDLAAIAEAAPEGVLAGPIVHGWVERGSLVPALEEVAWDLEAGESSAPIEARGGLHVLRVAEIQPASTRPLDEVEASIRGRLGQERYDQRVRELVAELERSAYVFENLPEEAVGYRAAGLAAADPLRDLMRGPAPVAAEPQPAAAEAGGESEAGGEPAEPASPPEAPPGSAD
ncbi:MAG TPA: peptidyl-prolyl cis-trans isomerase [Thermoanaerobaculia bacterium]|nr:peptidyl-prolyl cis-trans isomerase [Thermoanaerobaculia bacterium]